MSVKGKMVRLLGGLVLREARVVGAEAVGAGFRRIRLQSDALAGEAGGKIQILLPTDDVRTYTPIASKEGAVLLGWCHAGGPGARWVSEVEPGARIRFLGVQASLTFPPGPLVLVGDETSVAVAASFAAARPGLVQAVFEAASPDDLGPAAAAVNLRPTHVARRGDVTGIVDAVQGAHAKSPGAVIGLTGGSDLIVAVRAALRDRGLGDVRTKTYWVPGRSGLD